jgi:signal transduction histidine kinase
MSYRAKLLIAMSLVAVAITGIGLFIVERKVAAETEHDLEAGFKAELNALHTAQQVRQAALAERCRSLVRRPRILAALEDNALDLLYPSARDELRDLLGEPGTGRSLLRARFYRFLDADGRVLPDKSGDNIGDLSAAEEAQLTLKGLPKTPQLGFAWNEASQSVIELFAVPIISSETGATISALVVGLAPSTMQTNSSSMISGLLLDGTFHLPAGDPEERKIAARTVLYELEHGRTSDSRPIFVNKTKHRLFFNLLNPRSAFPPAYEVCLFSLSSLLARQEALRWQAAGICGVLLLGGVMSGQVLSKRLAKPVEKLEVVSAENLAQRKRAEQALELTSQELQRAARFSADASHQLKTPVAVLRAGLDELLATDELPPQSREEVSSLLHQTFRLNNIIEDLLLLSRMDAGRLRLQPGAVNLAEVIEAWMDDFSTLASADITVETSYKGDTLICGEKRYTTIIVENLLENARKYNRPGGRIKISIEHGESLVRLRVGNNGRTIAPEVQGHIFERFHRGTAGENVPGYGLGLNLARELARLHGGELRLVSSENDWTEFEVSFCPEQQLTTGKGAVFA